MCHEYGWSLDYVLDQPYSCLKALTVTIRLRQRRAAAQWITIIGLSTGGTADDVAKFLSSFDPPPEAPTISVDTDADGDQFAVS